MAAAIIRGTATSFGITNPELTMVATNITVNVSSNKVEAKNINGGVAAVAFIGKKAEYSVEGYMTSTNTATQGSTFQPANLAGFGTVTGGYYVEEVGITKASEDFAKIKYKVVQRDGIS